MLPPFQRLLHCVRPNSTPSQLILAASGSSIYSFDASNGVCLTKWSHIRSDELERSSPFIEQDPTDAEPPVKRRKLSRDDAVSDTPSAEIIINDEGGKPRGRRKKVAIVASIVKLLSTTDGKYVIVVTGEDKCIRVLELTDDGSLKQLSERQMPKKPSAIALTSEEATILCADKFGDVYALPLLLPSPLQKKDLENGSSQGISKSEEITKLRAFKPAASSLTVHTKKNQQALKNQLNTKPQAAEKKTLDFEHQLLLGHVSLLTDLTCVNLDVCGTSRSYILTADRDEHIRVSRNIPQTHIIESFCLGHSQFISKMLIPPAQPEVLISGGGDDYLLTWIWKTGELLHKTDLRQHIQDSSSSDGALCELPAISVKSSAGTTTRVPKIAVSGIWLTSLPRTDITGSNTVVAVTCEGLPYVVMYGLETSGKLTYEQTIAVEGNVLDIAILQDRILYSVDNVHSPGSTDIVDENKGRPHVGFLTFSGDERIWVRGPSAVTNIMNTWATQQPIDDVADTEPAMLSELLYHIEHLRKRDTEVQGQE